MGMSGDYEIAMGEGSTMIRIGSLIFGERQNRLLIKYLLTPWETKGLTKEHYGLNYKTSEITGFSIPVLRLKLIP